jgi:hypothetical protein
MTDLGDASFYLEVELIQGPDGIHFHQHGYIKKVLNRFGMLNYTPVNTPMNPRSKLTRETSSPSVDIKTYQSLIGALLHATISRWDIQFAVSCLSRYLTNPQLQHLLAAKHILRYLKGTLNYGIFYSTTDQGKLHTFTDADWAGDVDTHRSTSGISSVPPLFLGPINYNPLSHSHQRKLAARNITYLRHLYSELKIGDFEPAPIFYDNISSLKLVKNPIMHA